MSTRVKLFLSYLVMGFLPIILFIVVMVGLIARTVTASPFLMSLNNDHESILKGVEHMISLEILTRDNPKNLFDQKLLAEADGVLSPYHIGIILTDEHQNIFYASGFIDTKTLMPSIHAAENNLSKPWRHFDSARFIPMGYHMLDLDSDFTVLSRELADGAAGILYFAIETGPTRKVNDRLVGRFFTLLLLAMAGLIVLMTFLVTRSMMQSLKKLKAGVRHISEGDLNFSIRTKKRDEVAQVVMAFEEMRLRLKDSIETQVAEDENRRELVANISHDLKTPVTSIKGYVEGLIDGVADTPEKRQKYLTTILSKTIALDHMIDDLFLYSNLDTGRARYHFEVLPAADVMESLCEEARLDLAERGFEVQCSIQIPRSVKFKLDRQMLRRLLHNLTDNASKYGRESGCKAAFSAEVINGTLLCSLEDNGTGIQPEALPHIFERFYRADAARTSTVGGTGLGLQISRRIVEDHGGRIWAESEYGAYTRMIWTLPVVSEDDSLKEQNGQQEHQTHGGDSHA